MGFGAPWNLADITLSLKTRGDGQDINYTYRPVSPQSFVAWSPPGALTTQSAMYHAIVNLTGSGDRTITTGAAINSLLPWSASYIVIAPPVTSSVSKIMKGAGGDTGVPLIPWLPNIIALPSPLLNSWSLVYNMSGSEDLDFYIF